MTTTCPRYLSPADLCDLFPGTSPRTWKRLRARGEGPRVTRIGTRPLYDPSDVAAWAAAQKEAA